MDIEEMICRIEARAVFSFIPNILQAVYEKAKQNNQTENNEGQHFYLGFTAENTYIFASAENKEIREEEESEDKEEFEDKELEDKIYKLSELEEESKSFEDNNVYYRNMIRNNLKVGEA
ncbi:15524_t:CDS:2 [Cetraspora pellucida]|uniref:15524_t:CDS:1 n=1 Tax=Cetraspora pellucida TaxID=1433469 RepID=A0A9N9I819_9GLOM|nr:15524_t:CDS:2 [Cetraspora pellucida]